MKEELKIILGRKLYEQRNKAGLTQEDLARMMGISRVSLANIESGVQILTTVNLFKAANIFNCQLICLLPTKDELSYEPIKVITSLELRKLRRIEKLEKELIRLKGENK